MNIAKNRGNLGKKALLPPEGRKKTEPQSTVTSVLCIYSFLGSVTVADSYPI